ncbi:vesicle-associated membrane protein 8 [Latimeria chalumnae]|uniref:vesicle-associated membrane protein 8 n=1 Tax=Latimeria chalumnae TaxID=7897 RepID=UPI00313B1CF1
MASDTVDPSSFKIEILQDQVDDVKNIMTKNIDNVLNRGEKLHDLLNKTDDLQATATSFQRTTTRIARKMWWKNSKLIMSMMGIMSVIVTIIILLATRVIPT